MIKEWFPIPEYEGYYEASIYGQIRSVERFHKTHNRWGPMVRKRAAQLMSQCEGRDGYLLVKFCKKGRPRTHSVARLVLSACDRPPKKGEEACHENHDHQDNRIHNLEWGTRLENEQQKTKAGRRPHGPRWSQYG